MNAAEIKKYIDAKLKERAVQLFESSKHGYDIGRELGFLDDIAFYKWIKRVFGRSLLSIRRRRKK